MLRNREQLEIVADSEAWAKLRSLPTVQQGWKVLQEQYNNGSLALAGQVMETEENKELVALVGDAFSDEVFCYGDDGWADLFELYQAAYSATQYQPVIAQIDGKAAGRSAQPPALARALAAGQTPRVDQRPCTSSSASRCPTPGGPKSRSSAWRHSRSKWRKRSPT